MPATTMSPTKRSRDDEDASSYDAHPATAASPREDDGGRAKRSRRTRWEENDGDDNKDAEISKKPTTPQARGVVFSHPCL